MVRLLSKFQVVNSEANLFLLVHCSFRQGVTFGEAMSSPLRAYFFKGKVHEVGGSDRGQSDQMSQSQRQISSPGCISFTSAS